MKREFLQSLQVGEQGLSKQVIDAIMAENGRDIQAAKGQAQDWQSKYEQAVAEHEKAMQDLSVSYAVREAISSLGGRNDRAITALLDVEALKAAQDPRQAAREQVLQVKADCGYLFDSPTPPPYAGGTGAQGAGAVMTPGTLAGALRERFEGRG